MDRLSVPLDHYGERLTEGLYRVKPWSHLKLERVLKVEHPATAHLLLLDVYNLWDYPNRSYCRVYINDLLVDEYGSNGVRFIELPRALSGHDTLNLRVESDGPLPQDPICKLIPLDTDFDIPLGADVWFYPYLSDTVLCPALLKGDACTFFHAGTIYLPLFAAENRTIIPDFRVEFFQDDPYFRGKPYRFMLDGGGEKTDIVLPGFHRQSQMAIDLGHGAGRLKWVAVNMESTLPSAGTAVGSDTQGLNQRIGLCKNI